MNELALFAGVGGGILGGQQLGWRTVCAVEIDPYARRVLIERQNDGSLPAFPIWDDVRPLTVTNGTALLTWFQAASHAKTSALPEKEPELTEPNLAFGSKWRELSTRFDLDLCLWKTHQSLFIEALPESSVILPRWGLMRDGVLWGRTTPAHLTSATASGFVPTPQARDHKGSSKRSRNGESLDLPTWVRQNGLVPTLTVNGNNNRRGASKNSGDGLATWARKFQFPTPCAIDARGGRTNKSLSPNAALRPTLAKMIDGGPLNPTWLEWLMGFPSGWTELDASAMPKSRRKPRLRGKP